jgi:hypothetical protein
MAPSLNGARVVFATRNPDDLKAEVYRFHVRLLMTLTAADFRFGKA